MATLQAYGGQLRQAGIAMAILDAEPQPDKRLTEIEGWIDAGQPQRALDELVVSDIRDAAARRHLELRAWFALGEPERVVKVAEAEREGTAPDATLLAYGAYAAEVVGDPATADTLLTLASQRATDAERPEVVAAYLRVHALREDMTADELQAYACGQLGDFKQVALALADCAFQLGEMSLAVAWYRRARETRPAWPPGARANALGAEIWQLIYAAMDDEPEPERLRALIDELDILAHETTITAPSLRRPMLVNLGHAYRIVGDAESAAQAWDEALALPDVDAALWLQRCALSATEGVALPCDDLAARWATTPSARLVLAAAAIVVDQPARATALIDEASRDPEATNNDRALVEIERIRLQTGADDRRVQVIHVATMLTLYDQGVHEVPVLGWLVYHFRAAGPLQDRVREVIEELAANVELDPVRRDTLTHDVLRAGLDEVALSWLPQIQADALDASGAICSVRAARLLLRLYVRAFRFDEARNLQILLHARRPHDGRVTHEIAHALMEGGDRRAAYELLSGAINEGERDAAILLSWAQLAVTLGERRHAHRRMKSLEITPQSEEDHAQILLARAWLGVHGNDEAMLAGAAQISAATLGSIFTAGLIGRPARHAQVALGRVTHLRITQGSQALLDERIVVTEIENLTLPNVRVLHIDAFPWARELLGMRGGEMRVLTTPPFAGATATIVEVHDADRWNAIQAATLAKLLPSDATGIRAVTGDEATLMESVHQQTEVNAQVRRNVLQAAQQTGLAIALIAEALQITPRELLRKSEGWVPIGHSGTGADIIVDDAALTSGKRLVLDPMSILLLVELGVEDLLARLPVKPVVSRQAAWQLFDWWYVFERPKHGASGYTKVCDRHGRPIPPQTAAHRLAVLAYWRRVQRVVVELCETTPPLPVTNTAIQRELSRLGPAMVSGLGLAKAHGWVYVTEEPMPRAFAIEPFGCAVGSVHRLLVVAASRGWLPPADMVRAIGTMIRRGWRWVSFPVSALRLALQLNESERWLIVEALLRRVRRADPQIAFQTLFAMLRELDRNLIPNVDASRLRSLIASALPPVAARQTRRTLAHHFAQQHPGQLHRASRRALREWATRKPS
jgi:tetratricopeptide (TPR) repeat protein